MKVFEDRGRAMVEIENIFIFQVRQEVLVNQEFAKDLAEKINIKWYKSKKFVYTVLQQQKHGRHIDFIDSEYKAQDVTIFDDIDAASFSFKSF